MAEQIDIVLVVGSDWKWLYINGELMCDYHYVDDYLYSAIVGKEVKSFTTGAWRAGVEEALSKGSAAPERLPDDIKTVIWGAYRY